MSYLKRKEGFFGNFLDRITFGSFKPHIKLFQFHGIEYTDEHEEYRGLSSLFHWSNPGVWPIYNVVFPVGIPNLGNTWYMNALIQSLIAWDELEKYLSIFKNHIEKSESEDNSKSQSSYDQSDFEILKVEDNFQEKHYILKSFIDAYYALKHGETDWDKISSFYGHLCEQFTYIFEQEDAHELLMVLFDFFNKYAKEQVRLLPKLEYIRELKKMINAKDINDQDDSKKKESSKKTKFSESITTLSSSTNSEFNLARKLNATEYLKIKGKNTERSWFEGLTNPFTLVIASKFQWMEWKDYTWEKHELRYVLTVPCKNATLERNIVSDMKPEIIEGYQCIKCTIKEVLERINCLRAYYGDGIPRIKEMVLLEEEIFMRKYLELSEIDEEAFKQDFLNFTLKQQNSDHIMKLGKPQCKIIRQQFLTKLPRILCIHLNRLADFDMFGNISKNHAFIKFPNVLDISECFEGQDKQKYELKSVVEHLGGSNSGHFMTMRKLEWGKEQNSLKLDHDSNALKDKLRKSESIFGINGAISSEDLENYPGTWVRANDDLIDFISLKEVLHTDAYMLFYEKIDW